MRARYSDKAQERHYFVYKGALMVSSGGGFNACGVIKTAWLLSDRLETA